MANVNKKVRDIKSDLEKAGFVYDHTTGGHHHYYFMDPADIAKGLENPRQLIAVQLSEHSKGIKKGTLNGIYKDIEKGKQIQADYDYKMAEQLRIQERKRIREHEQKRAQSTHFARREIKNIFKGAVGNPTLARQEIAEKGLDLKRLNDKKAKPMPRSKYSKEFSR